MKTFVKKRLGDLRKEVLKAIDKEKSRARESPHFSMKDLVAVRAVQGGNTNLQGSRMYGSPIRPTIHFSLNHYVTSHSEGNWEDSGEVFITPFKDLVDKNSTTFFGGSPHDVFFVGHVDLPNNTVRIKRNKGESYERFKERIESKIKELGFEIIPTGIRTELGEKRYSAMRSQGHRIQEHFDTPFSKIETEADFSRAGGEFEEPLRENYIVEVCKRKGIDPYEFYKRHKRTWLPRLSRFYNFLREKKVKFETFNQWFARQKYLKT
jgi:hypothetical protein